MSDGQNNTAQDAWRSKLKWARHGVDSLIENVDLILKNEWDGCLCYDTSMNKTRLVKQPPKCREGLVFSLGVWTDENTTRLLVWLGYNYNIHIPAKAVRAVVQKVARSKEVHPVREWLGSLRWDGKPRLDGWLVKHAAADKELQYTSLVFSKWLIGAVARIYSPGCQADNVLVLEGRKGVGKTTFFRVLGGEWYTSMPHELGSQASYMALFGKMIVELPELSAVKRAADIEKVKAFVTTSVDNIRLPYAAEHQDYPRQCVMGGSTNDSEWIQEFDERRWWPVSVDEIDTDLLKRDRDQLWAEAKHRYDAGETWHLTDPEVLKSLSRGVENASEADPWEYKISKELQLKGMLEVTSDHILTSVIGIPRDRIGQFDQRRVVKVLRRLGFKRHQKRDGGIRKWIYQRTEVWDKVQVPTVTKLFPSE